MDPTALRLEKIRIAISHAERVVDLHARRYVAGMAVGLTGAVSVLVAVVVGSLSPFVGFPVLLALVTWSMAQVRRILRLSSWLNAVAAMALLEVDTLIAEEVG